jgi:hypothetical protein
LRKEKEYLTKTNNDILEQLQQTRLSATAVAYNKSKCKFYTGVSYDVFMTIFTFLSQFMIRTSLYNFSRSATETVLRSSVGGVKICSSGASVSAVYIAIGSMFSSFGNNALGDSFAYVISLRLGFRRNFLSVLLLN